MDAFESYTVIGRSRHIERNEKTYSKIVGYSKYIINYILKRNNRNIYYLKMHVYLMYIFVL